MTFIFFHIFNTKKNNVMLF